MEQLNLFILQAVNLSLILLKKHMINNIQEMKQRLEEIKQQARGWIESSNGNYEARLHAMGYYILQKNIEIFEELSHEN